MPRAAEVAEAFFADGADERHGTGGLDRRSRQRVGDRDHDRQPAGVVADARPLQHGAGARDADVGALGKHGVEVRADDDVRPRRLAAPHAEHVADGVEAHVAEAGGDEALAERLGARGFLERRRRDLGERHLVVEDRGLAGLQRVDCRDHVGAGEQATGRVVVDPRRRRLDRERQRESQRDGNDAKHHDQ